MTKIASFQSKPSWNINEQKNAVYCFQISLFVPEIFKKSRVSEMRFPTISAELFLQIDATENAVVNCLFYPSLEFSVIYNKKTG